MSWQWWVSQVFALIGLVFVVLSFQSKTTLKLIWLRTIATFFVFAGVIFLGNLSAILMCTAGILRNFVSLYFVYKPQSKNIIKVIAGILIVLLLIVLNVIFWQNYLNIFSIVIGSFNVYIFMQKKPATIRMCAVIAEILSIVYYILLFTPVNMFIEIIGLISAIVGIFRIDLKNRKLKQ